MSETFHSWINFYLEKEKMLYKERIITHLGIPREREGRSSQGIVSGPICSCNFVGF